MKTSTVTLIETARRRALRRAVASRGYVHTMRNGTIVERRPTRTQLAEAQRIVTSEASAELVQVPRTMLVELIDEAQDFARLLNDPKRAAQRRKSESGVIRADVADIATGWVRGDPPMFVELGDSTEVIFNDAAGRAH